MPDALLTQTFDTSDVARPLTPREALRAALDAHFAVAALGQSAPVTLHDSEFPAATETTLAWGESRDDVHVSASTDGVFLFHGTTHRLIAIAYAVDPKGWRPSDAASELTPSDLRLAGAL